LNRGPCDLPDLLDLRSALSNQGATLGCRHNQPECDWRSGHCAWRDKVVKVLFKLVANESKGFVNSVCVPGDGDNPLWVAAIADVDFCATFFAKSLDNIPFFPNYTSDFFALHDESDGEGDIGAALGDGEGRNGGDPRACLVQGAACHGGHHAEVGRGLERQRKVRLVEGDLVVGGAGGGGWAAKGGTTRLHSGFTDQPYFQSIFFS